MIVFNITDVGERIQDLIFFRDKLIVVYYRNEIRE